MFKQIKKLLIVFVLLFGIFLVACDKDCPECQECPGKDELCSGLIKPEDCPADKDCPECPDCSGKIDPSECPACPEPGDGVKVPTEIELVPESVAVGETKELVVLVTPDDAYAGYKFVSSDPSIVTVDEEGKVTGVRPGTATITVTSLLDGKVTSEAEVSVTEADSTMQDIDIVQRELKYLTDKLSSGYVSEDFSLPQPWNGDVKVVYTDADGAEIEDFKMPDLGEETSRLYNLSLTVSYREATLDGSVSLKLVKAAEGKNDFEKVNFAVEVAEALLAEYMVEGGSSKVAESILLPVSVYGIKLNWSSNKTYVLTSTGALTKPTNDEQVTFSITPKLGAASASKSYTITVAGYAKNDKLTYVKEQGVLKDIIDGTFYGKVALPSFDDKFGIKLTYVSSDEEVLTSDGEVKKGGQEVTLTVTAVYEDPNYPNDAFVEVFDIVVKTGEDNTQAYRTLKSAVIDKPEYAQLKHLPYGGADFVSNENKTYAISPAQMTTLKAALNDANSEVAFEFDEEDFAFTTDGDAVTGIELVSQYFRYHESKIKITYTIYTDGTKAEVSSTASYTWVLNTGIAEKRNTVYVGGRSNDQTSVNPAEVGDMLQTFSHWDKYVGIIGSDSARTGTLYSDGFSGYTIYVDVPTGLNEVKFTKDAEGNVTVEAKETAEAVRYQLFIKKHLALEITGYKAVYKENSSDPLKLNDNTNNAYIPVINVNYTKGWTYAGTWAEYYINTTGVTFHIPVSSLSMGGSFSDGVAMATYSKSTISVALQPNSAASDILNDYGSSYQINRNDTIGFDGYYPATVIAPQTSQALGYGVATEYKFTYGIEKGINNPDETIGRPQAIQYCIPSTLSTLWGTPFVVLAPYGFAYTTVHAQEKANLYAKGQGWLLGEDMSLKVFVEKYNLHSLNEVDSTYVVSAVNSFVASLAGVANTTEALSKVKAEDIKFEDISIEDLDKIVEYNKEYNKLNGNWQTKPEVVLAHDLIEKLIEAAKAELAKQEEYAKVTKDSFTAFRARLATLNGSDLVDAELLAKLDQAKRNYDGLTPGQKGLFDNGYDKNSEIAGFKFDKVLIKGILDAYEVELAIANANESVSESNVAEVNALKKSYDALKNVEIFADENADSHNKAQQLISSTNVEKLNALLFVVEVYGAKANSSKLDILKGNFDAADNKFQIGGKGDQLSFNKEIAAKSFNGYVYDPTPEDPENEDTVKDFAAYIASNKATNQANNEAESVRLVGEIKKEFAKLPSLSAGKLASDLTDAEKTALFNIIGDPNKSDNSKALLAQLLSVYTVLGLNSSSLEFKPYENETALTTLFKTAHENVGNFHWEKPTDEKDAEDPKILEKTFALLKAYDQNVADKVIALAEALPNRSIITLEDESNVTAARNAYKALSKQQKALADAYQSGYANTKITQCEERIKELKKSAAVTPVEIELNALPVPSTVTVDDEAQIKAARKSYNDLKEEWKQDITSENLNKLQRCEEALEQAKNAEATAEGGAYDLAVKMFKGLDLEDYEPEEGEVDIREGVSKAGEVKVNANNVARAKALVAAYEAMNELQKELFDELTADDEGWLYADLYLQLKSAVATYDKYVK